MSYKYYKIKIEKCDDLEGQHSKLISISYNFNCLGIEELNIDEKQVDQLLGEEAFVSGEIGSEIIKKVDSHLSDTLVYFNQKENTELYESDLQMNGFTFVLLENLEEEDWNSSWKTSFVPIDVSGYLTIYPSWYKEDQSLMTACNIKNDHFIYIYPGMGFGTGTHETTFLCLNLLYKLNIKYNFSCTNFKNCLDLGCGSGILGIVTDKYFDLQTTYCDVDKNALLNTQQNLTFNDLTNDLTSDKVVLRNQLSCDQYDVVFANIILSELIKEKVFIMNSVSNKGILILSGILNEQVSEIKKEFSQMTFIESETKHDWSCLAFIKS